MHLHTVALLRGNSLAVLKNLVLHALRSHLDRRILRIFGEDLRLFLKSLLGRHLFVGFLLLLHLQQQILQRRFCDRIGHQHRTRRIHLVLDGAHEDIQIQRHVHIRNRLAQVHSQRIAVTVRRIIQVGLHGHGHRSRIGSGSRFHGRFLGTAARDENTAKRQNSTGKTAKIHSISLANSDLEHNQ